MALSATEQAAADGRKRGGTERRRVSCGGGRAAAPENFEVFALHIPPTSTSTFRNGAQISDQFFDNIKICIFLIKRLF